MTDERTTPVRNSVLSETIDLLRHLDGHSEHRSAAAHCQRVLAESLAIEAEHGAPARERELAQMVADLLGAIGQATGRTVSTSASSGSVTAAIEALRDVVPVLGATQAPAANGGPSLAHVLEAIKAGYPSGDPRTHSLRVDGVNVVDREGQRIVNDWPPPRVGEAVEVHGVTCVVAHVAWVGAYAVVDVHPRRHYKGPRR